MNNKDIFKQGFKVVDMAKGGSNKYFFYCLLVPILLLNSLWIISYFRVVPYSPASHYEFVVDWIRENMPGNRKDKLLIADNYQTSSVQLMAGVGDPNPPLIAMLTSNDKGILSIQKRFPLEPFLQKHDRSVYYKIYTNTESYVKSVFEGLDIQDYTTPILYSIRNFREFLLTVNSHPTFQPRPRVLELEGFPYTVEKTNIRRAERNGGLFLSKKTILPEAEVVSHKDSMTIYSARFAKPVDIDEVELVFGKESKHSTVRALIEYKPETSNWHLLGDKPALLDIDQEGVGRVTIDPDVCRLEQRYNSLYYMKDQLSLFGQMQTENRNVGLDSRFPSFPDKLRNVKELQITLSPPLSRDVYFFDNGGFFEGLKTHYKTKDSIKLIETKIRSSNEYEGFGSYTGMVMDLRPHKLDNKKDFKVKTEINADIPSQTEIQALLRFSFDSTVWSDWFHIPVGKSFAGTNSVYAKFNYFQYKLILSSKDVNQTPEISGIRFSFNVPSETKFKDEEIK